MDATFWHDRWASNEIGFHKSEANPLLVKYVDELSLAKGSRLFLPLCGKTLDIGWLLSRGYRVAGAELSAVAIEQLFAELGVTPTITTVGSLDHYRAPQLDIFVGDIFTVTPELLGLVDAIYDRAALVALPRDMRARYAEHLMTLTGQAPQLLISFEYDQRVMEGPPFSVSNEEIREHYGQRYGIRVLTSLDVPGGLKGRCPAEEAVYLLVKNRLGRI
ncbi:MAG: thiopurine S-methyltransferase [Nitrospira sp.]|nr:thiopurine S-methyltransferase [Nitrospira sp.]